MPWRASRTADFSSSASAGTSTSRRSFPSTAAGRPSSSAACAHTAALHPPAGSDYFAYPRDVDWQMPPFAVGRIVWDNWTLRRARQLSLQVIDATRVVPAIHQNHEQYRRSTPGERQPAANPRSRGEPAARRRPDLDAHPCHARPDEAPAAAAGREQPGRTRRAPGGALTRPGCVGTLGALRRR